jgi:5-methylcytosine-specific restriction endonuclease McrA
MTYHGIVVDDHQNDIPDQVRHAVLLLLQGDAGKAQAALRSIDYKRLISDRRASVKARRARLAQQKIWRDQRPTGGTPNAQVVQIHSRQAVPLPTRLAIFQRDHFTCRYSHCRRRTLYVPVLRALSRLLPDVIPYQKNWRPLEDHILYWTYSTSLEHTRSFPDGGTSDTENLITACYRC